MVRSTSGSNLGGPSHSLDVLGASVPRPPSMIRKADYQPFHPELPPTFCFAIRSRFLGTPGRNQRIGT